QRLAQGPVVDAAGHLIGEVALQQLRDPARELHDLHAARHLALRVAEHLAVLAGDERRQRVALFIQQREEAREHPRAPHRRGLRPGVPRGLRARDRGAHILLASHHHLTRHRAGGGIEQRQARAGAARRPAADPVLPGPGRRWSARHYPGGYTSYNSAHRMHRQSPTFASLARELDRHVAAFARRLQLDLTARALAMTDCWVNVMGRGAVHGLHLHPLSTISGTYYVAVPAGSPGLKFEDPRLERFMASPPRLSGARRANRPWVILRARTGQVV